MSAYRVFKWLGWLAAAVALVAFTYYALAVRDAERRGDEPGQPLPGLSAPRATSP